MESTFCRKLLVSLMHLVEPALKFLVVGPQLRDASLQARQTSVPFLAEIHPSNRPRHPVEMKWPGDDEPSSKHVLAIEPP